VTDWDSAKEVPRPLLVMFNDPESKERVMSSLRCLRDADVPFKGISIAHDMTLCQRDESRRTTGPTSETGTRQ